MKKIALTQGQFALVDAENFEFLNSFKWYAHRDSNTFYAERSKKINGKQKPILMHRIIVNPAYGMEIDHIDHNGLNNQKVNLRIVTHQQNSMNQRSYIKQSSQFKGVSWFKRYKLWVAKIGHNKKLIHLGYFKNEIDAGITYNQKAVELFGEFACLNSIPEAYKNRTPVKYKAKTSSKYTGVVWRQDNQKWMAQIWKNKKKYYFGCFFDEEAAHQAVLRAKELALSE